MSVEGRLNSGPVEEPGQHRRKRPEEVERWGRGPKFAAGEAATPERIIGDLAAVERHSLAILTVYPDVLESAYGLSGRGLDSRGGVSGSAVETAVTDSPERARAQSAVVKVTNEVAEAEKRLGAAVRSLERAMGSRMSDRDRALRDARERWNR